MARATTSRPPKTSTIAVMLFLIMDRASALLQLIHAVWRKLRLYIKSPRGNPSKQLGSRSPFGADFERPVHLLERAARGLVGPLRHEWYGEPAAVHPVDQVLSLIHISEPTRLGMS